MSDTRGIYRKFDIRRTDGSSEPGGKHEHCAYFVIDLEHDPFAIPALRAYAKACMKTHPELARDLDAIVAGRLWAGGRRPPRPEKRCDCAACETERMGCACDGALDDGCFLCSPDRYIRPACPAPKE